VRTCCMEAALIHAKRPSCNCSIVTFSYLLPCSTGGLCNLLASPRQ
jgi:hypothetical protein